MIKLTEQDLRNIVKETLTEIYNKKKFHDGYKPIGKDKFKLENGHDIESEITLECLGQKCHIVNDDHCYVLYNQFPDDEYASPVTHIFSEAFEALKKLPNPH